MQIDRDSSNGKTPKEDTRDLPKLWDRRFIMFVSGTAVSILGNNVTSFLFGLVILDLSGSTFLYAAYLATANVTSFVGSVLSGVYLDRFSRVKTIYTLDFTTAALYAFLAFILSRHTIPFAVLFGICAVIGLINSAYTVTYRSLLPMIVSEENLQSSQFFVSAIDTLGLGMIPVATVLYSLFDIWIIFAGCAILFFIAACFETQIKVQENLGRKEESRITFRQYADDLYQGFRFMNKNKVLLAITLLFSLRMVIAGADDVVLLPYFKKIFTNGEYLYFFAMAFFSFGCLLASLIGYKGKIPSGKKDFLLKYIPLVFLIISGGYLFLPFALICAGKLIKGILSQLDLGLTENAQTVGAPNEIRGRIFGLAHTFDNIGLLVGQMLAGVLCDYFKETYSISIVCLVCLPFCLYLISMYRKNARDGKY